MPPKLIQIIYPARSEASACKLILAAIPQHRQIHVNWKHREPNDHFPGAKITSNRSPICLKFARQVLLCESVEVPLL